MSEELRWRQALYKIRVMSLWNVLLWQNIFKMDPRDICRAEQKEQGLVPCACDEGKHRGCLRSIALRSLTVTLVKLQTAVY